MSSRLFAYSLRFDSVSAQSIIHTSTGSNPVRLAPADAEGTIMGVARPVRHIVDKIAARHLRPTF
jgi:hypothetical protein